MPASFFDSNILLYVASKDVAKAERAEQVIAAGGTISIQVLNEIANVARRRMALSWPELHGLLDVFRRALVVEPVTVEVHELGLRVAERYRLATFDSMIAASALLANCDTLWSEDMQDGQVIDGTLTIRNPFADR